MRILWLCNVAIPQIAQAMGEKSTPFGGWLVSVANQIMEQKDNQLGICFPRYGKENAKGQIGDNLYYWGYSENAHKQYQYNETLDSKFVQIIHEFQPDVIHVWGTEYPRSLSMLKAANTCKNDHVVVSIQGLCTPYSLHYFNGIPEKVQHRFTVRDLLRRDNLTIQYQKFLQQAKWEQQTMKMTKNLIGRTTWDKACASQMSDGKYYYCCETLRPSFYENQWNYENCEKHSIFVSQSAYPIKGFHYVLEALPILLRKYPDLKVYTTGADPRTMKFYRISSYQKYIVELLNKYQLNDHVIFTGLLNEEKMCQQYQKANVFVSASSIENSPNSVGEAMLLGMPIVASYVGGTMDMLKDQEGYLYQQDAPYMLAYFVQSIFENTESAIAMGQKARAHALITHNAEKNMENLLSIYASVTNKGE